jgi:hypothetical protein
VVAGIFRPTMPMALGQNVENSSGLWSSVMQRSTPPPRVWPLLITERSSALSLSFLAASTSSNSSISNDGCHRWIER